MTVDIRVEHTDGQDDTYELSRLLIGCLCFTAWRDGLLFRDSSCGYEMAYTKRIQKNLQSIMTIMAKTQLIQMLSILSKKMYSASIIKKRFDLAIWGWLKSCLSPAILCPTLVWPLRVVTALILVLLIWATSYTLLGDSIVPGSNLFTLIMLFVLAYLAGQVISLVKLPPLLGMLLVGIVMRNLSLFNVTGVYVDIVLTLRKVAMVVILIKAGLGLDAGALRRLSMLVLRLAFIPCTVEAATVTLVSHALLGLPWLWGLLLGFVLGAISPAVVVPSLLLLKDQGYGEDKGIATLVIAASSLDDITAISGYGVVVSTIFSTGDLTHQLLQGPLEVIIGLTFGIFWGLLSIYVPHRADRWVVPARAVMVGSGGLFAVLGSQMIGFSGAGTLACITGAFIACCGWKSLDWSTNSNPVERIVSITWQLFQPILFGLIGTEINLSQLDGHTVGLGIGVLCVGLMIRVLACLLAIQGGALNLKEMLFVVISWFPKATVQAALGPVALDIVRKSGMNKESSEEKYASQVLTIAVLSILLTAPLGAIGIYVAGPRLLYKARSSTLLESDNLCSKAQVE